MLVLDRAHFEAPLPLQSLAQLELMPPALGLTCLGFVFSLSVTERAHFELMPSARSPTQLDPAPLTSDFGRMGPLMLPRSWSHLGASVPVTGTCRLASMLSASDLTELDLVLLVHSSCRLDLALPVLDPTRLGLPPLLRSLSRFGFLVLVPGACRPGAFLSAPDHTHPDPASSLQGMARSELTFPTTDHIRLGSLILVRSMS